MFAQSFCANTEEAMQAEFSGRRRTASEAERKEQNDGFCHNPRHTKDEAKNALQNIAGSFKEANQCSQP